jgi:hypothetical protein
MDFIISFCIIYFLLVPASLRLSGSARENNCIEEIERKHPPNPLLKGESDLAPLLRGD